MLRFLHTADWQIGRAFNMVEGDAAALLRQARIDVIDRIGALAVAEDAAFVVVAGDVFDAEGLTNTALRAPLARMARFPQVDWYLLPGNHDPDRREGIWDRLESLDLPANVRPVRQAAPVDVGGNAWLLPCPLLARAAADDPTAWLDGAETPPGAIRIGLAHGSIRDFGETEASLRAPLDPDRADKAGLAYLALGDWHRAQRINARTWYSGTPEPDRFIPPGQAAQQIATGQVLSVSVAGPSAIPAGLVVGRGTHGQHPDHAPPRRVPVRRGRPEERGSHRSGTRRRVPGLHRRRLHRPLRDQPALDPRRAAAHRSHPPHR